MKRIGNLFNRIISYENLVRAEKKARLGKTKRYGVKKFDRNPYENLVRLQKALIEDTYRTSEYCVYTIIADRGNKEREIYRLPYYPDRIVHLGDGVNMETVIIYGIALRDLIILKIIDKNY